VARTGRSARVLLPASSKASPEVLTHLLPDLSAYCTFETDQDLQHVARRHLASGGSLLVPEGDRHLWWLAVRTRRSRRRNLTILIMRGAPTSASLPARGRNTVKRALITILRASGARVYTLRGPFDVQKKAWQVTDPTPAIPTEMPPVARLRQSLGLPIDGLVISVLGSLAARKGVVQAVEGWARTDPAGRINGVLLLAGRVEREIEADLRRAVSMAEATVRGSTVLLNEYVDDHQLDAFVHASDLIICTYTNPGSSGLFIRAVAARKPVLAVADSDVGRVIAASGAGCLVTAPAVREFATTFGRLLDSGIPSTWSAGVERLQRSLSSEAEFTTTLLGGLPR
jgi:hypothetical protein